MSDLLHVPAEVSQVATAALATRDARNGGGTARSVTIATALATGVISAHELAELQDWHARNPDQVRDDLSTLLAGLYGGAPARVAWPRVASTSGMEGSGAMVALFAPPEVQSIAVKGGEPADNLHVTLFFLGKVDELDAALREGVSGKLATIAPTLEPTLIEFTHVEHFPADPEDSAQERPVVLVTGSPAVFDLRETLRLGFGDIGASEKFAFRPHMTIGYWPEGKAPEPYTKPGPLPEPIEFTAREVALVWAGDRETFAFGDRRHQPLTAALSPRDQLRARLAKLSRTVNTTDRTVLAKLHASATLALEEAVAQAARFLTARTKSAAGRSKENGQRVAAALGESQGRMSPAVLGALGLDEQDVLDGRFATFAATATALILAAERKKLAAAAIALGEDPDALEAQYAETIQTRAEAATALLVASLALLARQALSGSTVTPAQGELSGPVPFGVVRTAFLVASRGASVPLPVETGPGSATAELMGGKLAEIGTSLIDDLLAEHAGETGTIVSTKTWQVGDPLRPFEPHQALDGVSWDTVDYPPELAADPGEWPYVDVYEPGDHDGCQCELIEDWSPAEVSDLVSTPA
jgi:2'-5' RNA ligase